MAGPAQPNVQFYLGQRAGPSGITIDNILTRWEEEWAVRDHFVWIFPNKFKSQYASNAYSLTDSEVKEFRRNHMIAARCVQSYEVFLRSLGIELANLATGALRLLDPRRLAAVLADHPHNQLRVRRVLAFLAAVGLRAYMVSLVALLRQEMAQGCLQKIAANRKLWAASEREMPPGDVYARYVDGVPENFWQNTLVDWEDNEESVLIRQLVGPATAAPPPGDAGGAHSAELVGDPLAAGRPQGVSAAQPTTNVFRTHRAPGRDSHGRLHSDPVPARAPGPAAAPGALATQPRHLGACGAPDEDTTFTELPAPSAAQRPGPPATQDAEAPATTQSQGQGGAMPRPDDELAPAKRRLEPHASDEGTQDDSMDTTEDLGTSPPSTSASRRPAQGQGSAFLSAGLTVGDLQSGSRGLNVRFYLGQHRPSCGNIQELHALKGDYPSLERGHDYIQWLFPNYFSSRFNNKSPALTPEEACRFRRDEVIASKYIQSYKVFIDFLGLQLRSEEVGELKLVAPRRLQDALVRHPHNRDRICRLLASLATVGFRLYMPALVGLLAREIQNGCLKDLKYSRGLHPGDPSLLDTYKKYVDPLRITECTQVLPDELEEASVFFTKSSQSGTTVSLNLSGLD